jgi:hypothetical protein
MTGHDDLLQAASGIAARMQTLNEQAAAQYAHIVEAILSSRSRDARHIERTLDHLLDFCGHAPALRLYRRLCRHCWDIDPVAAVQYVRAYREMWDSGSSPPPPDPPAP